MAFWTRQVRVLVILRYWRSHYQFLKFAIANNFSELNSELNLFLLAKSWLKINSVVQTPVH
ncbi:hypothetical protein MEN41_12320 [Dolichospermum sp. ST_con]|nr:hypothetical protein [Dolichospermum sp. ST_con]